MAVVRVKRHLKEEPSELLLLACKKRKTEKETTSDFQFVATVDNKDNVSDHVRRALKSDTLKTQYKHHAIQNITDKLRSEKKLFSHNNRLKFVNCYRPLDGCTATSDESSACQLTVVDVVCEPHASEKQLLTKQVQTKMEEKDYVYDLYYLANPDWDQFNIDCGESEFSAHAVNKTDLFSSYQKEDEGESEDDEDDSNEENNWRNDYPDEEEEDSCGEAAMRLAASIKGCTLDDDDGDHGRSDLSSDYGEEDLVYGVDVCPSDISLYGQGYARYKAKVKKDLDDYDDYFHSSSSDD